MLLLRFAGGSGSDDANFTVSASTEHSPRPFLASTAPENLGQRSRHLLLVLARVTDKEVVGHDLILARPRPFGVPCKPDELLRARSLGRNNLKGMKGKPIILAALVIAVAAMVAGCAGNKKASVKVVVPNLIGLRSPAAQRLVDSRGLHWRWEDDAKPRPSNAFFINDEIVGQTLPPGRHVKRGTELILVPSSVKLVVSPLG